MRLGQLPQFLGEFPKSIMEIVGMNGMHGLADLNAADRIIKVANTKGVWPCIEEIIKVWMERHPRDWESYLFDLKDVRETRRDKKFGLSKDKTMRYTLDIPAPVMMMIRKVYTPEELPVDKEFCLKFAKKFPVFKVAEKL